MESDTVEKIREAFVTKSYFVTKHATTRMIERKILVTELEQAMTNAEVIEDYPQDKYGPSYLFMGTAINGKILHIQVAHPVVKVVTLYVPDLDEWETDLKKRRRK